MIPHLSPLIIICITIVAEALSLGIAGQERVYTVIRNRAMNTYGNIEIESLAKTTQKPNQFSCWLDEELILRTMKKSWYLTDTLEIIEKDNLRCEVGQAKHYLTKRLFCSKDRPSWSNYGTVRFWEPKGHVFLEGVDELITRDFNKDEKICGGRTWE